MSGRFAGTASSAIIGGSFPLLFGQTGAAAVGGGLGGAAGGIDWWSIWVCVINSWYCNRFCY